MALFDKDKSKEEKKDEKKETKAEKAARAGFKKMKFLKDFQSAFEDGSTVKLYTKDSVVEVPEEHAERFIAKKVAEEVKKV